MPNNFGISKHPCFCFSRCRKAPISGRRDYGWHEKIALKRFWPRKRSHRWSRFPFQRSNPDEESFHEIWRIQSRRQDDALDLARRDSGTLRPQRSWQDHSNLHVDWHAEDDERRCLNLRKVSQEWDRWSSKKNRALSTARRTLQFDLSWRAPEDDSAYQARSRQLAARRRHQRHPDSLLTHRAQKQARQGIQRSAQAVSNASCPSVWLDEDHHFGWADLGARCGVAPTNLGSN